MHSSICVLLCLLLCIPAAAQEVEFEIPSEIDIVQGQLSVVFQENVGEKEAIEIINKLQYEVLESNFSPVVISGQIESTLSDSELQKLHTDKLVLEAVQFTTPGPILSTNENADTREAAYMISVTFAPETTVAQAKKALEKHITLITIQTQKLPNEVIIAVGGQDEKAFQQLQNHKDVKWVSYVGTAIDS